MVTTDNEVGCSVVLTDDGVPDGFTGTTHTHSEWEKTKNGHTVGVSRKEGLVDTDTGKVVDVTGLGKTNDRVDEDVSLAGAGCADSQFTVSAVHRVSGLESDNLGPSELLKVETELGGSVCGLRYKLPDLK